MFSRFTSSKNKNLAVPAALFCSGVFITSSLVALPHMTRKFNSGNYVNSNQLPVHVLDKHKKWNNSKSNLNPFYYTQNFSSFINSNKGLDIDGYNKLIQVLAKSLQPQQAEDMLAKMEHDKVAPNVTTYKCILDAYAELGKFAFIAYSLIILLIFSLKDDQTTLRE